MGDLDASTHVGYLTLSLLETIAQYERSSIISRVKLGMEKWASSGYWNEGLIYGYDNIDKKLIVNIEESKIVQRIYQICLQSLEYKAIASRLNEQGIPTKSGKMFSIQSIKTILNNPIYIGINRWGYYKDWEKVRRNGLNNNPILTEGHHEAIIEKSLWEKVQAIQNVSKTSVSKNKNFNGDFLLSGILRCPKCGVCTVMIKRKKYDGSGYHLYYMRQAYHSKGKTACSVNLIQKEHVERQVIQTIKGLVYDSSIIEDVLQKLKSDLEANTYHLKSSLDVYRKKHAKAEGNQKKLDTDYFKNRLSAEHYNRLSEPLLIAKKEFEVEISKIEHELNRESLESFIDKETISLALKNFDDLFDSAATEQKKALIRALVKRIDVEQDRKNIKEIVFWFTT